MKAMIIVMLFFIMPDQTSLLFSDFRGRILLLIIGGLILSGYLWIRKIMQVDI